MYCGSVRGRVPLVATVRSSPMMRPLCAMYVYVYKKRVRSLSVSHFLKSFGFGQVTNERQQNQRDPIHTCRYIQLHTYQVAGEGPSHIRAQLWVSHELAPLFSHDRDLVYCAC